MKLNFNTSQTELLKKIEFDFDVTADLSDDQILDIDEKVSDYFALNGVKSDQVNGIGVVCESIIDLLSDL